MMQEAVEISDESLNDDIYFEISLLDIEFVVCISVCICKIRSR